MDPWYPIINKTNGYIKESIENEYLVLVSSDENNDTLKKCEELWNKIRTLIRFITNNSDDYDKKL